jgi:transglutaminase-like putative cysteine protease
VIYRLRHLTKYRYEKPVGFARCALRMTPREGPDQTLFSHDLVITPTPSRLENRVGQFGESVVSAMFATPHRELVIDVRSRVDVNRPVAGPLLFEAPWEEARRQAMAIDSLDFRSPAHFLYPSPMAPIVEAITDYARASFTPGRPVVEAAFDLARAIRRDFAYDPDSTEISTPAAEAFAARRGVCQDFAHIMIAGLRGLGLAAAYVSGFIRTYPAEGKPRLEGADATHAWVDLWCGHEHGWIGFDPTNGLIVAEEHVVVAAGRDYLDVAPISGIILGPGEQNIDVGVDLIPE